MRLNKKITDGEDNPGLAMSTSLRAMGAVIYLAQRSPLHKRYSIQMLLERVGPSLSLNYSRYYEGQKLGPIAFVNRTFLSDKILNEILATGRSPAIHEWESGTNLYFVELIAPFGHCHRVVCDLRQSIFKKGQRAFAVRGNIYEELPGKIRVQRFRV